MNWKRKLCLGLLIWPGSIILLIGGFALYNWATGRAALKASVQTWEAAGNPTAMSDLSPAPLDPDQEYFCQNRYLQAETQIVSSDGPVIYRDPELRKHFWETVRLPPDVQFSYESSLKDSVMTDFTAVAEAYQVNDPGVDSVEKVRRELMPLDDIYAELSDAARLPAGHFGMLHDVTDVTTVRIFHYSTWIRLTSIASLRSRVALAQGRSSQAYRELAVTFRIMETLEADPVMLSLILRSTMTSVLLNSIWEGLVRESWQPEELEMLQLELARLNLNQGFIRAVRGEAALLLQSRVTKPTREQLQLAYGSDIPIWLLVFPGMPNHNLANYIGHLQRFFLEPALHQDWQAYLDGWRAIEAIDDHNLRQLTTTTVLPVYRDTYRAQADQQGYIFMARTAIALELYKHQHGQYPADLADLTPAFLPILLVSPVDGSPMAYRPHNDRYELRLQTPADSDLLPPTRKPFFDWIWNYDTVASTGAP